MTPHHGRVWARWSAATLIGYGLGVALAIVLTSLLAAALPESVETDILVGMCVGASMGLAQTFVLHARARSRMRWVLGATVGFGAPFTLVVALSESLIGPTGADALWVVLTAVLAGTLGGAVQRSALRSTTRRAGRWVWMSAVLGTALSGVFLWASDPPLGLLVGAVVYGVLGGGLLARLPPDGHTDPGSLEKAV